MDVRYASAEVGGHRYTCSVVYKVLYPVEVPVPVSVDLMMMTGPIILRYVLTCPGHSGTCGYE